jgi:hypothetical protein
MGVSLMQAIRQFLMFGAEEHIIKHAALEAGGKLFLEKAKNAIGTYEYGWPQLAESTIARKERGDTPLLETGEMRDSGYVKATGQGVIVGFSDHKLVYHEWGTRHIPPRPVIGGTIDHHGQEIANKVGVVFGMIVGETLAVGNMTAAASNVLGGKVPGR